MTTPNFDFPVNLDDMSVDPDDLDAWALALFAAPLDITARTRTTLHRYARLKAKAMRHRWAGNLHFAAVYEAQCEQLYASLPKRYQW